VATRTTKLTDLTPDHANANKGTERGRYALEASLRKYGAGRSILIDRNGRIIAGNKTAETAADVGIDDVIVVQTDGKQIVAVQRTDLDLDSKEARELAYADNRVGQLDLDFDAEQILADLTAGVDLSALWRQDELDALIAELTPPDWGAGFSGAPTEDRAPFQQMTFTLHDTQAEQVKRAMAAAGKLGDFTDSPNQNSNGNALAFICETFLTEHGQS
jgi:hypothetical protein